MDSFEKFRQAAIVAGKIRPTARKDNWDPVHEPRECPFLALKRVNGKVYVSVDGVVKPLHGE